MKKFLFLFAALAVLGASYASFSSKKPLRKASEVFVPVGKTGKTISLQDLSAISVKEFERVSGKDMRFMDKVNFKLGQRQLRKSINPDGTLNSRKMEKFAKRVDGSDFNLGGFALGFLLGLIGVLIAYIISDDNKRVRTKWAWIGFGAAVVLYILLLVI
ncbi:MAG TPA: hypothetical protein VHK69_12590 [Chitinophagaceae bacterium]|jgi:hypothetical protein|nr:hypothetical protein [Chitinophagaceae bacterium]